MHENITPARINLSALFAFKIPVLNNKLPDILLRDFLLLYRDTCYVNMPKGPKRV
jgi:hypothetical protein